MFQRVAAGLGLFVAGFASAVFTSAGAPVCAQAEHEPDPCAHVFGQSDLNACWAREAERSDQEMDHVYLALRNKLPKRAARSLEKAQQLWKEFRQAHIATLYGVDSPAATFGREYPTCLSISFTTLTRARTRDLVRLLEDGDETVCPL